MKTLNQDIKNRTFKKAYLLYGNEDYLIRSYKNRLQESIAGEDTMNTLFLSGKDPDLNVLKEFTETMPFFADKRLAVLSDTGLFKSASEGFAEWIRDLPETACVIFAETEADKRNRLYKAVSETGYVCCLDHPDEKQLQAWMLGIIKNRGMNIRQDAFRAFLECISEDMDDIRNELEKLCDHAADTGVITREDVTAVCRVQLKNRIFDLTSQASYRRKKEALDLYYDLLRLREPPMRVLYLLSREISRLYAVRKMRQENRSRQDMTALLNVRPFVLDKMLGQANMYTDAQLEELMDLALDLEKSVKSGDLQEQLSVELLLLKMTDRG